MGIDVTKVGVKRGKGRQPVETKVGREHMIEAARAVLRETAPGTVTREMVAKRAGTDPGLVRYYFGTLENLIAEVAEATNSELSARIHAATLEGDPEQTLREGISAGMEMFMENPHHHEIMMRHQLGLRGGEIKERWRTFLGVSLDDLRQTLEKGAEAGALRKVDERFLLLLEVGTLQFFSTSEPLLKDLFGVSTRIEDLRESFLEFVQDLLLNGLKSRDDVPALPAGPE